MQIDNNENPVSTNPASTSTPFHGVPHFRVPVYTSSDSTGTIRMITPPTHPSPRYPSQPIEQFETPQIPPPLLCDPLLFPQRSSLNQPLRPDFDSSIQAFSFMHHGLARPNYPIFGSVHIPPPANSFRLYQQMSYPIGNSYINGYNSCSPQISMINCPKVPSTTSSFPLDPLLIDHNYTRNPVTTQNDADSLNTSEPTKRSFSQITLNSTTETPSSEPPQKKKKSYQPNRELIKIPLTLGFVRESVKLDASDTNSRKVIIYKTPDGKILYKKQDVRVFLNLNPTIELKADHFSFDSRLNLTPRRIIQKNDSLPESPAKKSRSRKIPDTSPKTSNNHTDGVHSKPLSARLKKSITKHFKKLTDDTKFLDGLSANAYRRKLPSFTKCSFSIIGEIESDCCNIFSDLLCVEEFLRNYYEKMNIDIVPVSAAKMLSFLIISDIEKNDFFEILNPLLRTVILNENFASEVLSGYFIDNLFSLEWNWFLVDQLFRRYLQTRLRTTLSIQPLSETPYHKTLSELDSMIENYSIYCVSPKYKASALRFLVDQLVSTSNFSSIINETVDYIARNRRDKFQLDTKIRVLKSKSSKAVPVEETQNGVPSDSKSLSGDKEELVQLQTERDRLRTEVGILGSSLRCLYLGSDRYGRTYNFSQVQQTLFIEGLATYPGLAQKKFLSTGHRLNKPTIPSQTLHDDLLFISTLFKERLSFNHDLTGLTDIVETSQNDHKLNESFMCLLTDCPKLIKDVSEEEFPLVVEIFDKQYQKHKKRGSVPNEFGQGWWLVDDSSTISELLKGLNQRGSREHALSKSLTRHQDVLSLLTASENSLISTGIYDITQNISQESYSKFVENLIKNEFNEIYIKMEKYLIKIGYENSFKKPEIDSNNSDFFVQIRELVNSFVHCCERKFDRNWLSRWNESLQFYTDMGSLYFLCLSFKLKIDPNSKICHLCSSINDASISECSVCLLCAHDNCLTEPMRKIKRTKSICSKCYDESVQRSNRICKVCGGKTGKTVVCSVCSEFFHLKCLGNKPKNKLDSIVCENCALANRISNPKIYNRPDLVFPRIPFKTYAPQCKELFTILNENKDAQPFMEPVDSTVPGYYEVIKKPMCFLTISKKLKTHKYKTISRFCHDIIQIFENCHIFNEDNSKIAKCGVRLQKLFEKEWKRISSSFSL